MARFDRNIRLFGAEGQCRVQACQAVVVGAGGLGQHVIPQLACLGVGSIQVVDDEELSETNRNRYVLANHSDPIPGTRKVDIAGRAIAAIDPKIIVSPVHAELRSREAFSALKAADVLIGCVDNDGARLVLNEFALAYGKPYFDLASDVEQGGSVRYGGRVILVGPAPGCLVCMGEIDPVAAREELESPLSRQDRDAIYGVDAALLDRAGPSVVSVNGVVASLAMTEFMAAVTGLRKPWRYLTYRGDLGVVTKGEPSASSGCYFCDVVRGSAERADVERYIRERTDQSVPA